MASNVFLDSNPTPELRLIPRLRQRTKRASKLDLVAWDAGISFTIYGVRIGIRANCAEILQQSLSYLPAGWKLSSSYSVERMYSILFQEDTEGRPHYVLYKDARQIFSSADGVALFERLESDLAMHVADTTHRRIFVHAGVVGWHGHAILVPGKHLAGKTTLVAELIRAGALYYSDEFAVIDSKGLVHPYPRPLKLKEKGSSTQKRLAEDLGGLTGRLPLPVGLVILSRYKSGARWRARPISPGQALLGILENTVSAKRAPASTLKTLKQVVSHSFMIKGTRGEAREVVEWIETHFHPELMFPASE